MKIKSLLFGERTKFSFTTTIAPVECIKRLQQGIARKRSKAWWDYTSDVAGNIDKQKFQLMHITLPLYRNSWNPMYYGRILSENGQTIISGYFDIVPTVKILSAVMITFLVLLEILILIVGLTGNFPSIAGWIVSLLIGALFLLFIMAMVKFGTKAGRYSRDRIINFINTTLQATPNPNDLATLPY